MKKAFTMLELVFVIVVIGILAAVVIPRTGSNRLHEAAVQVVSHIRYTQHLAMVDDKFDSGNASWQRSRWQIFFANTQGSGGGWAYSIFSDKAGGSTGNPDVSELAINPLDRSKYLTGGYSAGIIAFNDPRATAELNLGRKYGISNVTSSSSCVLNGGNLRISFDYLGRPLRGTISSDTSAYPSATRLITSTCTITLISNEGNVLIAIEPETGYACILNSAGTDCI